MEDFIFYIHSDVLELDNFSDQNFKKFIQQINPILEIGKHLKANVYYCKSEIQGLNSVFSDFEDAYIKNQKNILEEILKDFKPNIESNNFFKIHYSNENTSLEPVKFPFLNSKFENKKLVVFSLINEEEHNLLMVKSNDDFEKVKLNSFNNPRNIWKFINKNLPDRVYNFSPKHGNNNIKAISPNSENVSQLLCSDDAAQELLNNSIFDLRERSWCYNFDENFQTFIIFPCEGENPQNKYHAFHIDKDIDKWRKEIPNSILKYFNK
jgi:hypothetical protein